MSKKVYYGFRVGEEDYEKIRRVARDRGMDLADLLRELIKKELARLSLLPKEEQKSLGMIE